MFDRLRTRVLGTEQEEPYISPNVQELDPNQSRDAIKSKTWGTTVTRVPSWPEEARPLKQHNWVTYLYSFGDLILVILPIYFIREHYTPGNIAHLTAFSTRSCCCHAQWGAYQEP